MSNKCIYPYQNLSLVDMDGEVWKDVFNFPNYCVSNYGRIKSKRKIAHTPTNASYMIEERILKQYLRLGYLKVELYVNGKKKSLMVHRVVLSSFTQIMPNDLTCNHKNEDKLDNNISNLEWMSLLDNINYGTRVDRMVETQKRLKSKCKRINQYLLNGKFIKSYESIKQAAEENSLSKSNIGMCCRKVRNQVGGFIWRFNNDDDLTFCRKTTAKKVKQFTLDGVFVREYENITLAEKELKVSKGTISSCCKGVLDSVKSYKWEYSN